MVSSGEHSLCNTCMHHETYLPEIILHEQEVPIAVRTSAIQLHEGNQVVYVRHDNTYTMRKVETGQSNRNWTEILSGLQAGETYVSENSFIIKADIAKSTSEHSH